MQIQWINHSCFMVESDSNRIYFDPYEIPADFSSKTADIIFASHDHYDHFDEKSISIIKSDSTKIICPSSCKDKIKKYNAIGVKPGDKGSISGISYEAFPAYNPNKKFHPKSNKWVGYIVKIEGRRLFHAGDTDLIPEFVELAGTIDIAFLPVGDTYTMGFKDAIEAVSVIKPKIVIPMHHWDKNLNVFKEKCEKKNPETEVRILSNQAEIF